MEDKFTGNGHDYCGWPMINPYKIFLELNDIEYKNTKVGRPRSNGFVKRFNWDVLDEYLRETFLEKFYTSVADLQEDLSK